MAVCRLLTIKEAHRDPRIQIMGLSYDTFRAAVHSGRLKIVRVSKAPLIPEIELSKFVDRFTNPTEETTAA